MLLIAVGVSGLEGGGCPLCSISGRSLPGSAEVATTFSAQDVVVSGGLEEYRRQQAVFFSGHQPEFLNRLALGPAGRGGRAFRIPLPLRLQLQRGGRGELGRGGGASCSPRRGGWGEAQGPRERGQDLS